MRFPRTLTRISMHCAWKWRVWVSPQGRRKDSAYSPTPTNPTVGWVARVWWPCCASLSLSIKGGLYDPGSARAHRHMTVAATLSRGRLCPRHNDGSSCRGHLKICHWKIRHEFANCVPGPGFEVFKSQGRDASCLSC